MTVTSKEIRQARAYVYSRGLNSKDIPPKLLAAAHKKLGKSFNELVAFIALLKSQGQGRGQSPLASQLAGDV